MMPAAVVTGRSSTVDRGLPRVVVIASLLVAVVVVPWPLASWLAAAHWPGPGSLARAVADALALDWRSGAVPAGSARVRAACATSRPKSNCMSSPASGAPSHLPFTCDTSGRCSLPSHHAAPNSSGVANTGDKAERGLDCRKPKPLANSSGIRLRSETSLTSPRRRTQASACSGVAAIGTSPVTTTTSPSRSMP